MSEKRFTFYYERGNEVVIEDNGKRLSNKKVVDLLNEQQATIHELRNKNIILKNKIEDLRGSLIIQNELLQRQMQKRDLDG